MTAASTSPPSPCVGICRIDEASGCCIGCARTRDEIAIWRSADAAWRASVWEQLPARFDALGIACRRLPWDIPAIRAFVADTIRRNAGTWVMGVVGAVGEFTAAPGASMAATVEGTIVTGHAPGAALRVDIDDSMRALTFEPEGSPAERGRVVLAVKRERGAPPMMSVLTDLGMDQGAIRAEDRNLRLFDLGLGRKEARFCVRCGPGPALDALQRNAGVPFPACLPAIGPALLAASPTRVIESALGRLEVSNPIPPPGGQSPAGAHTHLLPDHLAIGRAMPVGLDLPRAYLPGAIFYPAA